jgi:hypothetical protein
MKNNLYIDGSKIGGICKYCGDSKIYTYHGKGKRKNTVYKMPYYFKLWRKTSWFRGDDEYIGIICKKCSSNLETIKEYEKNNT